MSFTRTAPVGLIAKTHQRVVMNSTATALNTTCQACDNFMIGVEGAGARVRFDNTNPTANTGVLLTSTSSPYFLGGVDATKMKFLRNASGTILQVAGLLPVSSRQSA